MSIEAVKYKYTTKDTEILVSYVENGVEKTTTVNAVFVNDEVDFNATEAVIVNAVYSGELPQAVLPPSTDN